MPSLPQPSSPATRASKRLGSVLESADKRGSDDEADGAQRPFVRKRKRLAKACDPCHKSKRRCDGKSPCGNCEFATKKCVYTDSLGRTVAAPHGRPEDLIALLFPRPATAPSSGPLRGNLFSTASVLPSSSVLPSTGPRAPFNTDKFPSHGQDGQTSAQDPYPWANAESLKQALSRQKLDIDSHVELDPDLKLQLVNLFLARCYPFNLIIHRATFLHDLAHDNLPNYILLCVLALAAPLSLHPALHTSYRWQQGEVFARAARDIMFDQQGLNIQPCLQVTQALCFLHIHEVTMRRLSHSNGHYMSMALDLLIQLDVHHLDNTRHDNAVPDNWLTTEGYRRIFWLIYFVELLWSAFTDRPLAFSESDLSVSLPMPDSQFQLMNMGGPRIEFLRPSGLGLAPPEEFGYLIRVTSIYSRIAAAVHENAPHSADARRELALTLQQCEQQLTAWQCALPQKLKFNENNINVHMPSFQLSGGPGWCFAFMHALAECCMLTIFEYFEQPPMSSSRQAINIITVILHYLDTKGRSNILSAILLESLSRHCLRIRQPLDDEGKKWYEEFKTLWGISIEDLNTLSFRQNWIGPRVHVPPLTNNQGVSAATQRSAVPANAVQPLSLIPPTLASTSHEYTHTPHQPMSGPSAYTPTPPPFSSSRTAHSPFTSLQIAPPQLANQTSYGPLPSLPPLPSIMGRQDLSQNSLPPLQRLGDHHVTQYQPMAYTPSYLPGPDIIGRPQRPHESSPYQYKGPALQPTSTLPTPTYTSSPSVADRIPSISPTDDHKAPNRNRQDLHFLLQDPRNGDPRHRTLS